VKTNSPGPGPGPEPGTGTGTGPGPGTGTGTGPGPGPGTRMTDPWWRQESLQHAKSIAVDLPPLDTDHDALALRRWGMGVPGPGETWRLYHRRSNLEHFTDRELLAGGPIPGRWAWSRLIVLGFLLERELRPVTGPLHLRSLWRPGQRNRDVGGALWSDHLFACGVDVDCVDTAARNRAFPVVRKLAEDDELCVRYGLTTRGYHLSVCAPAYWDPSAWRRWMYRHETKNNRTVALACAWDDAREPKV